MTRYDTRSIAELRTIRTNLLAGLQRPTLANRAQVEGYLAGVEAALVAKAVPATPAPATYRDGDTPLYLLKRGEAQPAGPADERRLAWAAWS